MKNNWLLIASCLTALFCAAPVNQRALAAPGDAGVTPGEFVVEHPTQRRLHIWMRARPAKMPNEVAIHATLEHLGEREHLDEPTSAR
jgi:hypothetical protein